MPSPQKENGYTPIANELFEAFYQCKLLEYERVCVMYIWRKTYGWGKKSDWIANSQFFRETGIPRPHVTRTLKLLKKKKIVTSSGNKISINKHYEEWDVEWRVLPHQVTTVTSPGNKVLPHQVPTKEKKETITKGGAVAPKSKIKTMAFRRQPDDYEEATIDADTGEVKPVDKPPKRQYKEVYDVFEEALGKRPLNWTVNVTQQRAAENLVKERGLKAIRNALKFYLDHKDEEFCPQISSPADLDAKWSKLAGFKSKTYGRG